MPIKTIFEPRHISEQEFHEIDFQTMGFAFDIQNRMGRFWSEQIYQKELAYRCQKAGFDKIDMELPIKVCFKDFKKVYYVDLVINKSVIYELKAVDALSGKHKNQTLNYLFLTGVNRGKLINMRSPTVESQFVSTKISSEGRFEFTIQDTAWNSFDDDCTWLKQLITDLLFEWGVYLDIYLYYEAVNHFRGGQESVVQEINVTSGKRTIGKQKTHMLNNEVAFKISAIVKDQDKYEEQLRKFAAFTELRAIQWINLNRNHIIFKTIS